jgi:hypothetical protein
MTSSLDCCRHRTQLYGQGALLSFDGIDAPKAGMDCEIYALTFQSHFRSFERDCGIKKLVVVLYMW